MTTLSNDKPDNIPHINQRGLCFWTQAPPLIDQAHGNHGIAREFASILQGKAQMLLTSQYRRRFSIAEIRQATGGIPLQLYPDSSFTGIRRFSPTLAAIVDLLLFIAFLLFLVTKLHQRGIREIFVLCGADVWFLIPVALVQQFGFEVHIYLVDELEASSQYGHNRTLKRLVHPLLKTVLKHSTRVSAISVGFSEHLTARFGCCAGWLPLPISQPPYHPTAFAPCLTDSRKIVFIGSLNHLYLDALQDLYMEIMEFNKRPEVDYKLHLDIITYGSGEDFLNLLHSTEHVTIYQNLPLAQRMAQMREAYACFLPYSFHIAEKLMVSTSFSCKIIEYYAAGRPILVYGPEYASIPEYFQRGGLPLCATNRSQLHKILPLIEKYDTAELLGMYRDTWAENHSPKAILSQLFR